ncbi:transcriptional regulator [Thermostilla marina]
MTQPRPIHPTQQATVPQELSELVQVIGELPVQYREIVEPALNRVIEATKRRRRILSMVQDALGQLRLDMKYMMFDLEATRRERDEYRRKLNEIDGSNDF